VRLAVGALPLRRWANDLRDAQAAVLLPQLDIDGEDVLRLRWAPDGTLTARLLERERSAGA